MFALNLRSLGNFDLQLSPIGLGCWQVSQGHGMIGKFWSALKDETVREIVQSSITGGINWCDTAEVYGWGASETAMTG